MNWRVRRKRIDTVRMSPARLLYGHRGAARERPENTIVSFERALEVGADVLETDLHITADGHLVLSHDPTGRRMTGVRAAIRDTTLADVSRWDAGWGFIAPDGSRPFAGQGHRIPTLERALVEFPAAAFNLDIKERRPQVVGPLLRLLRRLRADERVRLASFDLRVLASARARGYGGETALSQAEVKLLFALPAPLFRLAPCTGSAAQLPERAGSRVLAHRAVVDRCHRAGLRVDYWTINDPERAAELLALGADGLITDDPRTLRPVFTRLQART